MTRVGYYDTNKTCFIENEIYQFKYSIKVGNTSGMQNKYNIFCLNFNYVFQSMKKNKLYFEKNGSAL